MASIPEETSNIAYKMAKEVYQGIRSSTSAIEELAHKTGMNRGSAHDYIVNLKHMLNGEQYSRTLNIYTTKYFLVNIRSDFGEDAFRKALSALELHLDYYDKLKHGRHVRLRKILKEYSASLLSDRFHPEEVGTEEPLREGATRQITVNAYERNATARKECLKKYGYRCQVCEFDFKKAYGAIGENFIHVHHLMELSTIETEYIIDPVQDLRPVCPNCHAMLHKRKPAYSVEELRKLLKEAHS